MIKIYKQDAISLMANLDIEEGTLFNADEFKAELLGLFDQYHKRIILNFEQVEYIDSAFLGALISALKYLISFKSDIILVGLRKDIQEMFKLIRLDKVFSIYGSFNEATLQ
jgi:anti-sigma B factor antagonist